MYLIIIIPIVTLTVITFLGIWIYDLKETYKMHNHFDFQTQPIFRHTVISAALIVGSLFIVNYEILSGFLSSVEWIVYPVSILISLLISTLWFRHINKLDLYEPEKFKYLLGVFTAGAVCTFGVFPLSKAFNTWVIPGFNGGFINDLLYSILGIGLIEEFVKILPVFLLARFTKILNEPFDYLLFGTISALGFAFVENAMYLERTGFNAIDGRALFASPAHMVMTSYICYQWAISIFKSDKSTTVQFILAYLVSSIAHGLYDFWLISSSANLYSFISILILLLGLKIWVRLANNLMNISIFYKKEILFDARAFKYELTLYLIAILSVTYAAKAIVFNSDEANYLLLTSVLSYSFLMAYVGLNFSNIVIIKDYIAPLTDDFSFSLGMFLPLGVNKKSCDGTRVKLYLTDYMRLSVLGDQLFDQLPINGAIDRRIVVDNDITYYLFKPDRIIRLPGLNTEYYAITNLDSDQPLCGKKSVLATLYGFKHGVTINKSTFLKKELKRIQNIRCRGVFRKK